MSESLIILGDVHCNLNHCIKLANDNPSKTIIQIGDFGVGLMPTKFLQECLPVNFKFFCGNHDDKKEAVKLPSYLGEFGEFNSNVFFVGGADSRDKDTRIVGVDWWEYEEISYADSLRCIEGWKFSNAKILLAHDCPQYIAEGYKLIYDKSFTRLLLDEMISIRKPELVISGHHHKWHDIIHNGVRHIGLKIDQCYEI